MAPVRWRPGRQELLLGTSPPGGGFTPYGDALAAVINAQGGDIGIKPVFTKGSLENIPLLEAGKLTLGLAGGEATFEAFDRKPPASLKVVAPMYSSAGMFAVPGASPIRSIQDLRGKPVVFGAPGSSLGLQARYILRGMGLDIDKDFKKILLDRDDRALAMLADGRVAALWGGGTGWPAFEDMARRPGGVRFIVPTAPERAAIVRKYASIKELVVPALTYSGQANQLVSVGSWSIVLANARLPDATA